MPVHARRCDGCGGPLPEAPATATTVTCTFCGVVHEISMTRPVAAPYATRPAPLPPALDSLPLRDVLKHAHQSGRFPDRPFYSGFLIYEGRIGWVWTLQSLSGRDHIPIGRARDAAVYPWP